MKYCDDLKKKNGKRVLTDFFCDTASSVDLAAFLFLSVFFGFVAGVAACGFGRLVILSSSSFSNFLSSEIEHTVLMWEGGGIKKKTERLRIVKLSYFSSFHYVNSKTFHHFKM